MAYVIAITGTPGTGKTTLAKRIYDYFKHENKRVYLITQDELIKRTNSNIGFDHERNSIIVDEDKLRKDFKKSFESELNEYEIIIIDSHISHELKENVDLAIITKCDLEELKKRLIKRGYHEMKIHENINAELLNVIGNEVEDYNIKHIYYFTSNDKGLKEVFDAINNFDELIKDIENQIKSKERNN